MPKPNSLPMPLWESTLSLLPYSELAGAWRLGVLSTMSDAVRWVTREAMIISRSSFLPNGNYSKMVWSKFWMLWLILLKHEVKKDPLKKQSELATDLRFKGGYLFLEARKIEKRTYGKSSGISISKRSVSLRNELWLLESLGSLITLISLKHHSQIS